MYRNNVELIGFLGSDAEGKTTTSGKSLTTLSLATKTSFVQDGKRQERTEWHRIQAWGKLAEYAAAFKKGAHFSVEGAGGEEALIPAERGNSSGEHACACGADRETTRVRTL